MQLTWAVEGQGVHVVWGVVEPVLGVQTGSLSPQLLLSLPGHPYLLVHQGQRAPGAQLEEGIAEEDLLLGLLARLDTAVGTARIDGDLGVRRYQ